MDEDLHAKADDDNVTVRVFGAFKDVLMSAKWATGEGRGRRRRGRAC